MLSSHKQLFVMLISFKMTTIGGIAIFMTRTNVLAHRIRISDILFCDRKSYFTHVILSRLSREGCTLGGGGGNYLYMT